MANIETLIEELTLHGDEVRIWQDDGMWFVDLFDTENRSECASLPGAPCDRCSQWNHLESRGIVAGNRRKNLLDLVHP